MSHARLILYGVVKLSYFLILFFALLRFMVYTLYMPKKTSLSVFSPRDLHDQRKRVLKMTYFQMALKSGLSLSLIYNVERGLRPTEETAKRLAENYGTTLERFWELFREGQKGQSL